VRPCTGSQPRLWFKQGSLFKKSGAMAPSPASRPSSANNEHLLQLRCRDSARLTALRCKGDCLRHQPAAPRQPTGAARRLVGQSFAARNRFLNHNYQNQCEKGGSCHACQPGGYGSRLSITFRVAAAARHPKNLKDSLPGFNPFAEPMKARQAS
jgi:hypothetical protein